MSSSSKPTIDSGRGAPDASTAKLAPSDGHVPREWLVALGSGDLPENRREHVMAHVATCERCRSEASNHGFESTVLFDPNVLGVRAAPSHDALVGATLGEYRVDALLDEGAMGVVYRGVHPVIGKAVAIKVMRRDLADDPENRHRLVAEARAVNAIGHPNIVDVFAFGTLPDGRQYLVMELLSGMNLRVLRKDQGLPLTDALAILLQTSSALAAAHAASVVHRDVKPSNIFVSRHLGAVHVTMLDFGIAKGLNRTLSSVATQPGMMIGTAGFMAPEQIMGHEIGPAADVYSLGCVAFWLFAGEEVFTGTEEELHRFHVHAPPPLLSQRARVPPGLAALVNAMLAKEAATRPTAAQLQWQLSHLLAEARAPAPVAPASPTSESRPLVPPPWQAAITDRQPPVDSHAPGPPLRAPPTLPEMTLVNPPSRPASGAEGEETARPPPRRRRRIWYWIVGAALLAAAAIGAAFLSGRVPTG